MKARRENEVWEVVNREKRNIRKVSEGIKMEDWEKYFMELLGGVGDIGWWEEKKGGTWREMGRRRLAKGRL